MSALSVAAGVALAAWLWLLLFRGGFWRADRRLPREAPAPAAWPAVCAVLPARNEADHVGEAVASLLAQDYPGRLQIVLVDDASSDGTAAAAREAGAGDGRLTVVAGRPLEAGWTGKLWALAHGIERATEALPAARYVLLGDADIAHRPDVLRRLVAMAEARGLDLVSLMVRLNCASPWERLLIPAFVFFFQKLYPFPRVNDPARPEAAAAGGCMLVRRDALERAGGIAAIRGRVIDDCALAARIKRHGPIWLGLADDSRSLRAYDGLGGIWRMVARTAFVQLDHSLLRLAAAVLAMAVVYLVPPLAVAAGALAGDGAALALGAAGWAVMAFCYRPTLAAYGGSLGAALLLPAAALLYTAMMVDSARRSLAGRGAAWKGRSYSHRAGG